MLMDSSIENGAMILEFELVFVLKPLKVLEWKDITELWYDDVCMQLVLVSSPSIYIIIQALTRVSFEHRARSKLQAFWVSENVAPNKKTNTNQLNFLTV